MRIKGRHVGEIRPVAADFVGQISNGGVIRVDDSNNLDAWLEIEVSPDEIWELMLTRAHEACSHNRQQVEESLWCGCFQCVSWFRPESIKEWIDHGETAKCPNCGIDAVLSDQSGFLWMDDERDLTYGLNFLTRMRKRWFGRPSDMTPKEVADNKAVVRRAILAKRAQKKPGSPG